MSISSDISSLMANPYTGAAASNTAGTDANGLGKDDFLRLLVTQLQHQDPLSPMENTEFISQMAQFRQLESANNMENSIDDLNTSIVGMVDLQRDSAYAVTNASAISLIGKEVRLREESVYFSGAKDESIPVRVNLGSASAAVVEITELDGTVIRTLKTGTKLDDNSAAVYWDGTSDNGEYVIRGTYRISIQGQDSNPQLYAFVEDAVSGVRFDENGSILRIAGKELSIANLVDVSGANASSAYAGLSQDSAIALIGKHVHLYTTHLLSDGASTQCIEFKVNMGGRESALVEILDSNGTVVDTVEIGRDDVVEGIASLSWDGRGSGEYMDMLAKGEYRIHIEGEESNPYLYAFVDGMVTGVNTAAGVTQVMVNGAYVPLYLIFEISDGIPAQAGNGSMEDETAEEDIV